MSTAAAAQNNIGYSMGQMSPKTS